jgi:pantetheine-phosphate adenylyltransferase
MKIAIYPGSFDPITLGHVDIISRMTKLFDQVIVLISHSTQKESLFTVEERKAMIEQTFLNNKNVKVDIHYGLTVDYVKKFPGSVIVRGLRAVVDFEYELTMSNMNRQIAPEIETLLVFSSPEYYYISSRGVKEVARFGGPLKGLVSDHVGNELVKKIREK